MHVSEGLEFKRVTAGIEQEQCGLFPGLALETDIRLNDKLCTGLAQPFGQGLPLWHGQHYAEMWHRHVMPIDRIASCDTR